MTAFVSASGSADAATITRRGTFNVTVTILSPSTIPKATLFTLRASVIVNGTQTRQTEAATQLVAKTKDTQIVTISVPYLWKLEQPVNSKASLTIGVSATTSNQQPLFNEATRTFAVTLPAHGATTSVATSLRL
ncbi:hypothetical protein CQW49_06485 [Methylosinus trichosporium OB3b]|uniref:Uncharacterized protein n=2 Tax=Methylocystaceae TaxID=31993 RepID=A0A2D2CXW7_METT3|nr:hypothetical protein CQW49_06485 [Methylosinus trichosporium OB3b]OBS52117.1 hypothetical protein A8B73_12425 [Methylosinus sp. 3S-1]